MSDSKQNGSARFRLSRRNLVSAAVLGAAATGAAGLHNPDDQLSWDVMEPVAFKRRMPATPRFPRMIDGYTGYTGQTKCRPIARAGVIGVREHRPAHLRQPGVADRRPLHRIGQRALRRPRPRCRLQCVQ